MYELAITAAILGCLFWALADYASYRWALEQRTLQSVLFHVALAALIALAFFRWK